MGKHYGKKQKPRRPEKDEDDDPPTEEQVRGKTANLMRAANKAARRLMHTFGTRQNHHCADCHGVTDFQTCVKKGHQVYCEAHDTYYWHKGQCVSCAKQEQREVVHEREERVAEKEREKQDQANREDFFIVLPERKKPGTKKDKLHEPVA